MMRVLFYRYGSICEPFILSAFSELGIEVTQLAPEMEDKHIMPSKIVQIVNKTFMSKHYDLVFSINFFPAVSDVCNIYHIPYAGWTVDAPVMELYSKSIANACNYLFLFDECQYEEIAPLNPGHVFYLPLASDPDFMQDVIQKNVAHVDDCSGISFIGSLYTEKCAYDKLENAPSYLVGFLDGLMDVQQKINGIDIIEGLLTQQVIDSFKAHMPHYYAPLDAPYLTDAAIISKYYIGNKISSLERVRIIKRLSSCFPLIIYTGSDTTGIPNIQNRGLAKTLSEMPIIFYKSTINLNITSKPIRTGIPLRVWDILACKGFVLTNCQTEITEYFTVGESIEVYKDEDDLADKCRYYLEHPARAKEIAENGFMQVKKHHTYCHRMEQLIRTVIKAKHQDR